MITQVKTKILIVYALFDLGE